MNILFTESVIVATFQDRAVSGYSDAVKNAAHGIIINQYYMGPI